MDKFKPEKTNIAGRGVTVEDRVKQAMNNIKEASKVDLETQYREIEAHLFGLESQIEELRRDAAECMEAREKLREREELFRETFANAPIGMILTDMRARYLQANPTYCKIIGYNEQELSSLEFDFRRLTHPDDMPHTIKEMRRLLAGEISAYHIEKRYIRKDGEVIWVRVNATLRSNAEGRPFQMIGLVEDINDRKRAEEALRESEHRLDFATRAANEAIWDWNLETGKVTRNDIYTASFGAPPEGVGFVQWWSEHVHPDDRMHVLTCLEDLAAGVRDSMSVEYRFLLPDGSWGYIHDRAKVISYRNGKAARIVGAMLDITERKKMEEEIRHMAQHDALTDLPNRRLFIDILKVELAQARRHKSKLAILFLDLDRFKEINDSLGHETGDLLLKQVANRFRETIRESDNVARIGGDEFNIVLSDINRIEDISDIAEKLIESLRAPITIGGNELNITTSIGISIYPDDAFEIDTLLRYADIAMYHAKETGRNTYRFFDVSINVKTFERIRLENLLRQTIERGELVLFYQPQINISSNRTVSVEALVRWRHPEKGLLTPDQFIHLAEETGFITALDEWTLRAACTQARAWQDLNGHSVHITVNRASRCLRRPDEFKIISKILSDTGLKPQNLNIEISESAAMADIERTAPVLAKLAQIGVQISIDDFGTGYSSLNYLKKLPIGKIKIDKSFIRDIGTDADNRIIVSAMTSMARKMGIIVVAEGVETEEQLSFLRFSQCDEAQGFLFCGPVPAKELEKIFTD